MHSLKHVAIIMDGNGRWAQGKFRPRVWGHIRGARVVSDIVEEASDLGLMALTLYAFSTENWGRPQEEIQVLLKILDKFLRRERAKILRNKIKFKVIGDLTGIATSTLKVIQDLEAETVAATGLKLTFAFGYGSRNEIVSAINRYIQKRPGELISEELLEQEFYNPETGDVDLLIRSGGDERISNFLLWQSAYAELFFSPKPWPEMKKEDLRQIIDEVTQRERRFGGLGPGVDIHQAQLKSKLNQSLILEVHS